MIKAMEKFEKMNKSFSQCAAVFEEQGHFKREIDIYA
jgi:hypothetical protein